MYNERSRKRCPSGKILNPQTNRCVNKNGSIGRRLLAQQCNPDQQLNPQTNRCVNKAGSIGRRVRSPQHRLCRPDQIINPQTNRCVKKTGSIGRRLLAQQERLNDVQRVERPLSPSVELIKQYRPKQSNSVRNINKDILDLYGFPIFEMLAVETQTPVPNIIFKRLVGEGGYGRVFEVEMDTERIIVKIQQLKNKTIALKELKLEFKNQEKFYNAGIGAPEPLMVGTFTNKKKIYGVITMKLEYFARDFGMLKDMLGRKLPRVELEKIGTMLEMLIDQLCAKNLIHGDMHYGNIGLQYASSSTNPQIELGVEIDGQRFWVSPFIIDFGLSKFGIPCLRELEIMQLIRTMYPQVGGDTIHRYNRGVLYAMFYTMLCKSGDDGKRLASKLPKKPTWSDREVELVDELHTKVFRYYVRNIL